MTMIIRIPALSAVYILVNERPWFMTSILTLRRTIEDHIMGGLIYQTFLLRKLFALVVIPSTESRPTCWTFNTFTSIYVYCWHCSTLLMLWIYGNTQGIQKSSVFKCMWLFILEMTFLGMAKLIFEMMAWLTIFILLNFWSSFTYQPFYLGQLDSFMHEVKD